MRRTKGLLLFSLVLFIESEGMFQRQKNKTFHLSPLYMRKLSRQKGAHKMDYQDKAENCVIKPHHISTKCVDMLFINFTRFLVILKYPDSFGGVRKVLNNLKIYMACVENAWKVIKPTGHMYVSSCSPESFLTF